MAYRTAEDKGGTGLSTVYLGIALRSVFTTPLSSIFTLMGILLLATHFTILPGSQRHAPGRLLIHHI